MNSRTRYPPAWALVSLAWIGPAILAAFEAYMQARLGNRPPVTWRVIAWEGGDWLIYALLTPIVFKLARRFPLTRARLVRYLPIHFVASIALCACWAVAGSVLRSMMFTDLPAPDLIGTAGWFFTSLPFGVAV